MADDMLLDRKIFRDIKKMDRKALNNFINNVYNTGKADAIKEIKAVELNIEQIRTEISEIKGIGETRLNQIMDIISKNI